MAWMGCCRPVSMTCAQELKGASRMHPADRPCPAHHPLQAWYTGEGALGSLSKFANGF